jgi:predicted cupin superfamily sugar epimerase
VHVIDPGGVHREHALGLDLAAGEHPVLSVPRGWLQAAELPVGEPFAFGANVCAPCFEFREFELTPRAELLARWPQHAELVLRLTHV